MGSIVEKKFNNYIESINKSIADENWTSALAIAFMLPDMCSQLEYTDLNYVGDKYRKWFNNYLHDKYNDWQPMLSAHDFYALRCSYLHSGESDISENKQRKLVDEFKFRAPKISKGKRTGSHLIKIDKYLILRVDLFCLEICEAVGKWIEHNKDDIKIQNKVAKIIEIDDESILLNGIYIE